mmetsp:Transcript_3336/g.7875  ORF Transcript_3336/g.7875 Transcript_3336/m.7875 type:complete len:828 (-) Transcript_3336:577-3060(-)
MSSELNGHCLTTVLPDVAKPSKLSIEQRPAPSVIDLETRIGLQNQIAWNFGQLVFHLSNGAVNVTDDECAEYAEDIEGQAFDALMQLVQHSESTPVSKHYSEVASNLMVVRVEQIILNATAVQHVNVKVNVRRDLSTVSLSSCKMDLAPLRTTSLEPETPSREARTTPRRPANGWLEPGSRILPYVVLKDEVVIIGRGREAYESHQVHRRGSNLGKGTPGMPEARLSAPPPEGRFIEVADGRVSRIHCVVQVDKSDGFWPLVYLTDWSSNGTYVNGNRINTEDKRVALKDGDRISLVLSVTPLAEQFFIFHLGDPLQAEVGSPRDGFCGFLAGSPCRRRTSQLSPMPLAASQISRISTSRYNTKEWTTLDDLQCQICLSALDKCVALVPCGHNFCATCLSQHFGSLLQSGLPLTCPLRCAAPECIVANRAVRALLENREPLSTPDTAMSSSRVASAGGDLGATSDTSWRGSPGIKGHQALPMEEAGMDMSILCPLYDHMLPLEAVSLKARQVQVSLDQLSYGEQDPDKLMGALEALARLSWSDDSIREEVAQASGIEAMIQTIRRHPDREGIQCNGCLALMSLVRGEGEVCQANQWRVAKAGGVETIIQAMANFADQPMVQLSALLCLIPMALENPMMQARWRLHLPTTTNGLRCVSLLGTRSTPGPAPRPAQQMPLLSPSWQEHCPGFAENRLVQAHTADLALPLICKAMQNHPNEAEVQAKAMVVLGVLAQGDEAVHDAIRSRELSSNVQGHIAQAIRAFGGQNDEVFSSRIAFSEFIPARSIRLARFREVKTIFKQFRLCIVSSGALGSFIQLGCTDERGRRAL